MKELADAHTNAKPIHIKEGDQHLIPQERKDKCTTPYTPKPYTITHRDGSQITAQNQEQQITRTASYFKKIRPNLNLPDVRHEAEHDTGESQVPRHTTRCRKPPTDLKDYRT